MQDLFSRLETLDSKTSTLPIDEIARSTEFVRRSPRKSEARQWLRAICLLAVLPARSFRTLGWLLGLIEGDNHSKQNVGKRMNAGFESFLREVLKAMATNLVGPSGRVDPALKNFGRVIVQDSTIIGLPARLADRFPGAKNQTEKVDAGMRIQAFFDLVSETCLAFSTSPFTRNDQKASADVLGIVRPGDLVIRDLGYSSLAVFQRLKEAGVYFLSRLRYGTLVFDASGNLIDLLALLQRKGTVDMQVYIGAKAQVPVRLVAVPVPETVAAERRRKARLNRDRRTNPSQEHMRLLGWTILVTTVPAERLDSCVLVNTYALRWRIETLFKAWKSHFRFGSVPPYASSTFVCALILAGLIHVAVFQCVFQALHSRDTAELPHLSPLKLASIIQNLAAIELQTIIDATDEQKLLDMTLYHCRYDRRKRLNYYQALENLTLG